MAFGNSTPAGASGSTRPAWAGWILAGMGLGLNAWANTPSPEPPTQQFAFIQPLNRLEAEQERLQQQLRQQPPSYLDKVMTDGGMEPAELQEELTNPAQGLRSWVAETRLNHTTSRQTALAGSHSTELGLRLSYRQESLNHGEWLLQTEGRHHSPSAVGLHPFLSSSQQAHGQRITLRNLGMPLTPFVFADSALGDLSSEVTDGLSRGQQLSLGSSTVRGASLRMFGRSFDLRAGLGQRGQLAGGPYPGFERAQGQLSWGGYTHRFDDRHYAAAQINHATQVPWHFLSAGNSVQPQADTTSLAVSLGRGVNLHGPGDRRVRLTLLSSQSRLDTGERKNAQALHLEAGLHTGRFRHDGGFYRTQPWLRFGDQWMANGAQGLFWRMDHNGQRLNWGLGLDHERQPGQDAFGFPYRRTSLNAHGQYRIDRQSSWSGYLQHSVQHSDGSLGHGAGQQSSYASMSYQNRWGQWGDSRLRLTVRRNQTLVTQAPSATGEELEWEQDWLSQQTGGLNGTQLRTTLGWARDRSAGDTQTYPTAGLSWQTWLEPDWSLSTHLRYTSRSGNLATSQGLSGSLQTERRLGGHWTLGASLLMNQAVVNVQAAALPLSGATVSRSNTTTALVFLRYERQHGQPYGFNLRGVQGAGAGSIRGVVFFDTNRDGQQQADETGVPGVEVFMNQRLSTLTDERGRYSFTLVPTGTQSLSLRPESVPLPWGEGPGSQTRVEVPLRGEAFAPLAVVKVSE